MNERAPYQPVPSAPYAAPAHQHAAHAAAAPPSRKLVAIVITGMVVLGGGIAALVIADRARGSGPSPAPGDAAVVVAADAAIKDDPPSKPAVDPWAGPAAPQVPDKWATSSAPDGTKVAVTQGLSIIVPSSFKHNEQAGIMVAMDGRGVIIAGGPIMASTDNAKELARLHARMNHLTFDSMDKVFVGGVQRPMAIFHGTYAGHNIRHVAVPLIGPGYRVAVTFQFPVHLASDPSVQALALDLYTRRIVLP